jgi:cob(I)alamin adenosyltransferase
VAASTGLIHIITGGGKGKTTAAVGLAVRARGAGLRVLFLQFLKGRPTGELAPLEAVGVEIGRAQTKKFIPEMSAAERAVCRAEQEACFEKAENAAKNGGAALIVLDELAGALSSGMLSAGRVEAFLKTRGQAEIVMTGRDFPQFLLNTADYVSDIQCVRHPYDKGVPARKGIEF